MNHINLVVQVPFWHYERGHIISDTAEIEKVIEHHDKFVTRISVPDDVVPFFEVKLGSEELQTRLGPEK